MTSITIPTISRFSSRIISCLNSSNISFRSLLIGGNTTKIYQRKFATEGVKEAAPTDQQQQGTLAQNDNKNTVKQDQTTNDNVDNLLKQIQELKTKNSELMDKYKRALADSENLRKRLTKQIDDAKLFGIQSFCKDLLEVADILGHATDAVPKDQVTDQNPHLKNLYEGLTMTKASLTQVFKRHGLEPINPINEKFDPNLHEALFQKEVKDSEPNTVVEVSKIGYKLHERCIRPALVGVSKS